MKYPILFLLICMGFSVSGQTNESDFTALNKVLNDFLYNTTYNYPDSISKDFYKEADLYLYNLLDSVWIVNAEEYSNFFRRKKSGTKNNRVGKIVEVKIVNDIAFVEYEVYVPSFNSKFTDLCLLKKINGNWKFITKVATQVYSAEKEDLVPFTPMKDTIISGLRNPWSMAFLDKDHVIVAEKNGGLVYVNLKTKERQAISNIPTDVAGEILIDTSKYDKGIFPHSMHGKRSSGNNGFFKLLLDPNFSDNKYIYLSYSALDAEKRSGLKVIIAKLDNDVLSDKMEIFRVNNYVNGIWHYGGGMEFGNDGKLYITTGDRLFFEYVQKDKFIAQDVSDSRGKIIRINSDGSIPVDNPDFGKSAMPGLFAIGIRASQGIVKHPITGDLWFSEHGTNQGDEINVLKEGLNYGWPIKTTGTYRTRDFDPQYSFDTEFEEPVHYWSQTVAPTGLTFYTGKEFPAWENNLFVAGLSKGSLWRLVIEEHSILSVEELFINDKVRSRGIMQSPDGKLYLLTNEEDGKIILIKPKR